MEVKTGRMKGKSNKVTKRDWLTVWCIIKMLGYNCLLLGGLSAFTRLLLFHWPWSRLAHAMLSLTPPKLPK